MPLTVHSEPLLQNNRKILKLLHLDSVRTALTILITFTLTHKKDIYLDRYYHTPGHSLLKRRDKILYTLVYYQDKQVNIMFRRGQNFSLLL